MTKQLKRKRRPWTAHELLRFDLAWEARGDQLAETFDRHWAAELGLSNGSIKAKRRARGLINRPPVRACHIRVESVCSGPPGDLGGPEVCCNCADGFDLPMVSVALEVPR